MDHTEAVRLQAAEKYLLGELSLVQLEEYETHYFDCPACAEDLKTTAAFIESSRQVFHDEVVQTVDAKRLAPTVGWFAWLRPAFAIPVFAALLLCIIYQNSVTIPGLKQTASRALTAEVVKSFSLDSAGTRGEGASPLMIRVNPQEDFGLDVDMPGNSPNGFVCQIQDKTGWVQSTMLVSAQAARNGVHIHVPGGSLPAGEWYFVIYTGQEAPAPSEHRKPDFVSPFNVEIIR